MRLKIAESNFFDLLTLFFFASSFRSKINF